MKKLCFQAFALAAVLAAPAALAQEEEDDELKSTTSGQRYITPEQLEQRQKELGQFLGLIPPDEPQKPEGTAPSQQIMEGATSPEAGAAAGAEEPPPDKQIMQAVEEFWQAEREKSTGESEDETGEEAEGNEEESPPGEEE